MKIYKNGVTREMTSEEEAAYNAEQSAQAQREAEAAAAARIPRIKRWAGQIILARLPDWKQSNMHAESAEIILALLLNGSLTPEQEARKTVLEEWRAWSKAVRAESARLEANPELTVENAEVPTPPESKP